MKKFFKNHFKRFVSFISVLCVTSLFCINVFAADAWLNVNRPANGARLYNGFIGVTSDLAISSTILDPDDEGWYLFDNASMSVTDWRLRFPSTSWKVVLSTEYDYYLTILIGSTDSANFKLDINNVAIREFDFDSEPNYKGHYLENLVVDNYDGYRAGDEFPAVAIFGKLADDFAGDISQILFRCSEGSVLPANVLMSINLFQVDKNTSASDVQKIVNAINQQTITIDDSINNQTDVIINGTDDTDDTVSDFDEVFDDFNDRISEWEEFDDDIISEWDDANAEYQTQLSDFNLSTSLLKAGNWLSTSMQNIYDNSSDYKMLWLVPLLFGIPILLFVIGKGREE